MGYSIGAQSARGERLDGFRVGANGSQDVLAAVLLGGYAVGRFEHSDRIRGSWVTPMPIRTRELDEAGHPPFYDSRTRRVFEAWLGYNLNDCAWLEMDERAMTIGRKLKPVTCPVLAGLLTWIDARYDDTTPEIGTLDGADLLQLVAALTAVVEHTTPNCWHDQVVELLRIATLALAHNGNIYFG